MSLNRIFAQAVLTLGTAIYVYSGDHPPRPTPEIETGPTAPIAPIYFPSPNLTNLTIVNDTEFPTVTYKTTYFTPMVLPNTTHLCWPNISRAFWATMLHHEKKYTGKHYQRLLDRYRELTKNFNEHLMQMVSTADEIRNLIYYNDTQEELLDVLRERNRGESTTQKRETTTEIPANSIDDEEEETTEKDSLTKVVVPMLLIVILLLLTYIAFLYRKLQFAYLRVAGISLILATESKGLSIKSADGEISESASKSDNASPPVHFPEIESSQDEILVQGTPILYLGNFMNSTNQTIIKNMKKKMDDLAKDELPRTMAVILNDNDTQHDTQNTTYINLNVSSNESVVSLTASKLQVKSTKLYNNESSKRTTIIFLVSVALVSTFFYVLLVSLRKILERKYGDKELLVQNDEVKRDDYY